MVLDFATQESLEIFNPDEESVKTGLNSLADLVDHTTTPFGRRLIRKWLGAPLINVEMLHIRQEAVEDLLNNYTVV
jgi:DNA mismatch repair ATPase MutS